MALPKAIVLVSGGMDSLTTLALARQEKQDVYLLHFNYQQKTEKRERTCFANIAKHYKITSDHTRVVSLDFFHEIGGSSLTDKQVPVKVYQGKQVDAHFAKAQNGAIPNSYVPFRNSIFIALAVAWAEVIKATKVYIGAVDEDSSGYPDCRKAYYQAYNKLLKVGTKDGQIQIVTPVITLSKAQIIQQALALNAPLHFTWPCYQDGEVACGICDSCLLRRRAYRQLGLEDPLNYRHPFPG
jgi:7-cyano-7-deazaguanine synthase